MAYDYAALATEITTDPAKLGYAGMTSVQAAATINAAIIDAPALHVSIPLVMTYLRLNNLWLPIKAAAAQGVVAAIAAVDLNQDLRITTIDFTAPIVVQMLTALQQTTPALLSAQNAADLTAMGTQKMSRATQLGWGPQPVYTGDIDRVRA